MFSIFRKMICLVSFVLIFSVVGDVRAGDVIWTDAGPDHLWSTATNWDTGTVPMYDSDNVKINMLPGPTVANEDAVANNVIIGVGGSTGTVTVDGGTLAVRRGLRLSDDNNENSVGILNMVSGTITTEKTDLTVGRYYSGTLNMKGGTITVGRNFRIAQNSTAIGHVNLDRGIIATNDFEMRYDAGAVGTMDIKAGTLIINGDQVSTVQEYIDNGWITAYGGFGSKLQLDYDVTNEGKTTLTAADIFNPNPTYGSSVSAGPIQLQWTLPEPNQPGGVVTCDVYFGTDGTVENNPKVVDRQAVESVSVTLAPDTIYYWAIDLYDSSISTAEPSILSPMYTFNTNNQPPVVNAGADVVTWLADGPRTGNLDATVTDDGAIIPYTVQWIVVSEPNDPNSPDAVIADPTAEDTSITLAALGEYVLRLEAFDGEDTRSDTVTINVYNDGCEAAQSLPDYVPLAGDLNGDCKVDDDDLALLQENWLKDNSLTEDWSLVD